MRVESFIASNGGVGSRTYLVDSADQNTDYTMLTLDLDSDGVLSSFFYFIISIPILSWNFPSMLISRELAVR